MKGLILGIVLLLICFTVTAQYGSIEGIIRYKADSALIPGATISIIGTKFGSISDENGYFELDSLEFGLYSIFYQSIGCGSGTMENIKINTNEKVLLNLTLPSGNCDQHIPEKCPIDGNKKNIIPIIYGLPSQSTMKKSNKEKVRLGSCFVSECNPKWFCKTHQIEF